MSRRKALINIHKIKDESEIPILEDQINIYSVNQNVRSEQTDRSLRNRYLLITVNGIMGLFLMVLELQTSWTGATLEINQASKIIRALIFILTLILVVQLMDYYRLLLSDVTHGWLTKKARGFRVTPINVLKSTTLAPLFWAEVIICMIQPMPFVSGIDVWWKDSKWGLLMWFRLYLFGRVLRDFSAIYQSRSAISKKFPISPKFNWGLSFKSILAKRPIATYLVITFTILLITGHILYIFEREVNPKFTFPIAFYISFLSMSTGWPTDTYDEYNPYTFIGRFGAILSCVLGLLLLSCLIDNFGRLTQPNSHQRPLLNHLTLIEVSKMEKDSAAKLIQCVWKRWRWRNSENSFSQNRDLFNSLEAQHCVKYIENVKTFERNRRYRKEIISYLKDNSSTPTPPDTSSSLEELKQMFEKKFTQDQIVKESLELKIKQLEDNQNLLTNQLSLLIQQQQQQQQLQFQQNQQLFYQQQQQQQLINNANNNVNNNNNNNNNNLNGADG